jgi:hypothetical protein
LSSKYEDALTRYEDALSLCHDSKKILYHVLHGIANIAFRDSSRCSKAKELFHLVPESPDIDYLRNLAWLDYLCTESHADTPSFHRLVDAETMIFDSSRGPLMRQLVMDYEHANLFSWTRKSTDHLRSLKSATLIFCGEQLSPRVLHIMQAGDDRQNNPIWGTLGLWSLQPPEAVDATSRTCLAKLAEKLQGALAEFSGTNESAAKTWLHWYETHLVNH